MSVRVRFAPSPTGLLHVGALRTALYCHLFATKFGGTNILRIEDTDRTRYSADSEAEFISTLKWVGITFDEGPHVGGNFGPYRQSERKEAGLYTPFVDQLLESGDAYWAFETPEELDEMRTFQQVNKMPTGYFGGDWREASSAQVEEARAAGKRGVIRLKIPRDTTIRAEDAIRGMLEWDSNTIDDAVLIKADGMPTYHCAAMVDDHLMEITHVFRGEEWISSFPKHAYFMQALNLDMPRFVHCPVITGSDGKKLSKRHGATSVLDYAAMGILPDPLKNFIALIGWSPGEDREVLSPDELVQAFGLKGMQRSPGRFDFQKLLWMNGVSIREMGAGEATDKFLELAGWDVTAKYWSEKDEELGKLDPEVTWKAVTTLAERALSDRGFVEEVVALEKDRASTLIDFGPMASFLVTDSVEFDEKATAKWFGEPHVREMFEHFVASLEGRASASVEECESLVKEYAASKEFEKLGPVVHPTRVALTGKTVGPGLFELMSLLGPTRMTERFTRAMEILR